MQKYKKIVMDIILNVVATAVPLIVLQLIILPSLADKMNEESYGLILTMISIFTVICGSFGNALNNIRLIKNAEYEKQKMQGDFSLILLCETILSAIIVIVSFQHLKLIFIDYILSVILAILWISREYYIVAFRIRLDFRGIVFNNIALVTGYIIGYGLFLIYSYWEIIYILGMLFSIIYIVKKTDITREKVCITPLLQGTIQELFFLTFASLVNSLLNYADRLVIYPLIGGAAVSIYYSSTLFGKLVSTAVTPLNSVMLSYLAKKRNLQKGILKRVVAVSVVAACIGYLICRIIAYPALNIIYPKWADESIKYVPITTLVAMLNMIISVLSPFLLKYCKMKWQLIINISVLITYLFCSVTLYNVWGLTGFCIGVLISNIIKLLIMLILGFKATKLEENR